MALSQVTKMSLRSPDPLYAHIQEGCNATTLGIHLQQMHCTWFSLKSCSLWKWSSYTRVQIKCCTTSIKTMWICQVYVVLLHAFQQLFCMTEWGPSFWYNVVKWNSTPRCSNWLLYSNCRSLNIQFIIFKLEHTIKQICTRIARLVKLDLSVKD